MVQVINTGHELVTLHLGTTVNSSAIVMTVDKGNISGVESSTCQSDWGELE